MSIDIIFVKETTKEMVELMNEYKKQGALLFWKKLKVKIENEDFEEWIDIDTNDKSLNKDKLIEWVEKELV